MQKKKTTTAEDDEQKEKELQAAIEEANRANQAKSNFLSHVSHDIRTPLNVILAYSNDEMIRDATESELREYIHKINISGEYLRGIINDVLDMSKIEQKQFVLHPEVYALEDFENTIRSVIEELCHNKKIEFIMDRSCAPISAIQTDHTRFNQIFINLLSNAVKFTPPGGRVEFLIEYCGRMDNRKILRFTVRDNGIGMSREFIPQAFESFTQEYHHTCETRSEGTGLGLAIVKELVTMMDGDLRLESELNKGTTFTIDIPFEVVDNMEIIPAQKKSDYKVLQGVHVLLAEDNDMNAEIAIALLKKQGCLVDCVKNGKAACEKFGESSEGYYQIVLMDNRMPVMDGLTAAKKIRGMQRQDAITIPIISMSADAFIEDERAAQEAGMNAYVSKPIDVRTLYNVCSQFISQ